jgi:hypothetical protein
MKEELNEIRLLRVAITKISKNKKFTIWIQKKKQIKNLNLIYL